MKFINIFSLGMTFVSIFVAYMAAARIDIEPNMTLVTLFGTSAVCFDMFFLLTFKE